MYWLLRKDVCGREGWWVGSGIFAIDDDHRQNVEEIYSCDVDTSADFRFINSKQSKLIYQPQPIIIFFLSDLVIYCI